jgi:hypothetical protein
MPSGCALAPEPGNRRVSKLSGGQQASSRSPSRWPGGRGTSSRGSPESLDGVLAPQLFDLRGIDLAAWTLLAFALGVAAGR